MMLRIFRSLRNKLLSENRMKKYVLYAFGEIVLVVIGILIALQINNWNEVRKERLSEHQILKALKEDMEISVKQLGRKINGVSNIRFQDSTTLVLIKEKNTNIDNDSLMKLLTGYTAPPTFDPESGTIHEILNSGKSSIISNPEIRKFISSWSSYIANIKEIEISFNRFFYNRKKPYFSKFLPYRNNRRDVFGISNYHLDKTEIFSNLEFENLVMESWVNCNILELRYKNLQSIIIELLKVLESEINEK